MCTAGLFVIGWIIDFYLAGKLHLDEMVSKRISLGDINEAFVDMKSGSVARSVVVFDQ